MVVVDKVYKKLGQKWNEVERNLKGKGDYKSKKKVACSSE